MPTKGDTCGLQVRLSTHPSTQPSEATSVEVGELDEREVRSDSGKAERVELSREKLAPLDELVLELDTKDGTLIRAGGVMDRWLTGCMCVCALGSGHGPLSLTCS
jgi:hypothetical protein